MLGPVPADKDLVRTSPQGSGAVKPIMGKRSVVPTNYPTITGSSVLSQVVVVWKIPNLGLFKDQGGILPCVLKRHKAAKNVERNASK